MYACGAGEQMEGMSFFDKLKQAGKSLVDSGAKTMLKVCCVETVLTPTAVRLSDPIWKKSQNPLKREPDWGRGGVSNKTFCAEQF
jgi:outer membrane biogenesis lipoprotein LolB